MRKQQAMSKDSLHKRQQHAEKHDSQDSLSTMIPNGVTPRADRDFAWTSTDFHGTSRETALPRDMLSALCLTCETN